MNVMVAGLSGSGKTTHAKLLADQFKLHYISGSETRLRHVHPTQKPVHPGFWRLSHSAELLDKERMKRPEADLAADEEMRQISLERAGIVFDVWALPWLSGGLALRIWLEIRRAHV